MDESLRSIDWKFLIVDARINVSTAGMGIGEVSRNSDFCGF